MPDSKNFMARCSIKGPTGLIRRGAYGLALVLPVFASVASSEPSKKDKIFNPLSLSPDVLELSDSMLDDGSARYGLNEFPPLPSQWTEETKISKKGLLIAEEPRYLIAEVLIEGLENHPDKKRLRYAAYDAMSIRPGSKVSREDVKRDLEAIYSTGWFSGVTIDPKDTPLGVAIVVKVQPNPSFEKIEISPEKSKLEISLA